MTGTGPVEAPQQVVENESRPESQRCPASLGGPGWSIGQTYVRVDGDHELERFEQVVGNPGQDLLLSQAFGHQLELELRQVPNSSVEQFGGPPRSAGGDVVLLDQCDPEAA